VISDTRVIVWHSLVDHSLEMCWIKRVGPTWGFSGSAVLVEDDVPVSLSYTLDLDISARSTRFDGRFRLGSVPEQSLTLDGIAGGNWHSGGDAHAVSQHPPLVGPSCIDLGWTPLTNTFAIWHLDLAIGASAEITTAWMPFPRLTFESSQQRYTRLTERRYRYDQAAIDFTAELEVDDDGVVQRYGDIWEQIPFQRGQS